MHTDHMDTCNLLMFVLLFSYSGYLCRVCGVQITSLRVPKEVRNGTDKVILDCEYTLRPGEVSATSGLVVKWFFDNRPMPVYQWIPGNKPQDLGVLRGRLDLNYRASSHDASMHRALCIVNPTTELSGEYKCEVSTFYDDDFMIKPMIVYAEEKKIEIVQSDTDVQSVNITCRATGLYPEPKMALSRGSHVKNLQLMREVRVVTNIRDGQYDISASTLLEDSELSAPLVVDCSLWIPHTSYTKHKTVNYHPGRALAWTDSGSEKTKRDLWLLLSVFIVSWFSLY